MAEQEIFNLKVASSILAGGTFAFPLGDLWRMRLRHWIDGHRTGFWLLAYSLASAGFWASVVMSSFYPVPGVAILGFGIALTIGGGACTEGIGQAGKCLGLFVGIGFIVTAIAVDETSGLLYVAWFFISGAAIVLTALGLALAWWAHSEGWGQDPPPTWLGVVGVALSVCMPIVGLIQRGRTVRASHDPAVIIDDTAGTFRGVSFGDDTSQVVAKLGQPVARRRFGVGGYNYDGLSVVFKTRDRLRIQSRG